MMPVGKTAVYAGPRLTTSFCQLGASDSYHHVNGYAQYLKLIIEFAGLIKVVSYFSVTA